jgi:hypothetical protein
MTLYFFEYLQFRLSQTSSSSLANEEEIEHRQLAAYINPYFRVTRKEVINGSFLFIYLFI